MSAGEVTAMIIVTMFVTAGLLALGAATVMWWYQGDDVIKELQQKVAEQEEEIDDLYEENEYLTNQWTDALHRMAMAGISTATFDDKNCEVCAGKPELCFESHCPLQLQPSTPTCTVEECVLCNQKPMMESPKDNNGTQTYLNTNPTAEQA